MIHDRTETALSAGRGQFVSGVLLGLSIGLAAGHLLIFGRSAGEDVADDALVTSAQWEPFESESPAGESSGLATDVEFSVLEFDSGPDSGRTTLSDEPPEGGLHFFPESMDSTHTEQSPSGNSQLAFESPGKAESSLQVTADVTSGRDDAPQALQPVPTAAPIDEQTSQREQLARRLIQEELPDATQQERDVWYDVLQGLPAEDIKGILGMRKRLGSGSASALGNGVAFPMGILGPDPKPPIAARHALPQFAAEGRYEKSITTLRALRDLDRQNLLNRDTIAYKRLVPMIAEDLTGDEPGTHSGIRLIGVTRDMSPGELRPTGRPLDIAIDSNASRRAFLQVRQGDEVRYTRAGRLSLDEDGRLRLLTTRENWLLEPSISIPSDTGQLVIKTDGRVLVTRAEGSDVSEIGNIAAVLFFNPAGLLPAGEGLCRATEAAGRPVVTSFGTALTGKLFQGHVESSNIDETSLRERLRWQESMIELIAD